MLERPERGDCEEYYFIYIDQTPEGDILDALASEFETTKEVLASIPVEHETGTYEEGKWTVREALGHVIDTERAFSNRAFAMARGDTQPIPGFDQLEYASASNANERTVEDLVREWEAVRSSTLALFRSLPEAAWDNEGIASGFRFKVRTFPFIVLGHELHHRRIFEERYIPAMG